MALVLTLGACSESPPAARPTVADTVAEVRAAREAVEEPAVALHDRTRLLVAAVEELRTSEDEDPRDRVIAVERARSGPLAELDAAIDAAGEVELRSDVDAVAAAADALDAAARAARDVLVAADRDLSDLQRAAEVDASLAAMADRWEQPGSRSQQLERLAALTADADALAADLEKTDPVASCLTGWDRRAAAAQHVADATRELRGHVEAYRGEEFDRLRAELVEDPYALERPLVAADAEEVVCWREEAPVALAAAVVDAALARLEAALNPPAPTPSPSG